MAGNIVNDKVVKLNMESASVDEDLDLVESVEKQQQDHPKPRKQAATKRRHHKYPITQAKPCSIYSSAADSIAIADIPDYDADEDTIHTQTRKARLPSKRSAREALLTYLDQPSAEVTAINQRSPTRTPDYINVDSPCCTPPPPDVFATSQRRMGYDTATSKVVREIDVALTNARCTQSDMSSLADDYICPIRVTPGGSVSVIDVDIPHVRDSIMVKVRSRLGLHRFQLQMTECFSQIMRDIAEMEGVGKECIKLTMGVMDIHEYDTPQSINLHIADIIDCLIMEQADICSSEHMVQVVIQGSAKNSNMTQTIPRNAKLQDVMKEYSTFSSHPLTKLAFFFDGDLIQPTDTPDSLSFEEDTNTIDVRVK